MSSQKQGADESGTEAFCEPGTSIAFVGMSESLNLGISKARGAKVSFRSQHLPMAAAVFKIRSTYRAITEDKYSKYARTEIATYHCVYERGRR